MHESIRVIDQIKHRLLVLEEAVSDLRRQIHLLDVKLQRSEQSKMSTKDALELFDVLKRDDPKLSMVKFAEQYGVSYEAVRRARVRRNKKQREM